MSRFLVNKFCTYYLNFEGIRHNFLPKYCIPKNPNRASSVSYLYSGGTGSTAIILSSDGKIVGRSTGQGTNHWV